MLARVGKGKDVLAQAFVTKYYRLGDLNNRNLFSYSSGDWEAQN